MIIKQKRSKAILHAHTKPSSALVIGELPIVVDIALSHKIKTLAITEHDYGEPLTRADKPKIKKFFGATDLSLIEKLKFHQEYKKELGEYTFTDMGNTVIQVEKNGESIYLLDAQEVTTKQGEILVYGEKFIEPNQDIFDVVENITNGFSIIPHAYLPEVGIGKENTIKLDKLNKELGRKTIMETFNSRNILPGNNKKARNLAERIGARKVATPDANCFLLLDESFITIPDKYITSKNLIKNIETAITNNDHCSVERQVGYWYNVLGACRILATQVLTGQGEVLNYLKK